MNLFGLSSIFIFIVSFLLTILLFLKGRKEPLAFLWGWFCVAAGVWGLSGYIISNLSTYKGALFWWKIAYIGVTFPPLLYFHFVYHLVKLNKKWLLGCAYLLAIVFILFNFVMPQLLIGDLRFIFNQLFWPDWIKSFKFSYIVYYLFFYWFLLGYSFILLVKFYKSSFGISRIQLRYFIIASIVGWLGAELNFFPNFRINIYPICNFLIGLHTIPIAYAIIKHRLMDIHVTITRTGIFGTVYVLTLGIPFTITLWGKEHLYPYFGEFWWVPSFIFLGILASTGPFIYMYLQRKAVDFLLKEERRYQEALLVLAKEMVNEKDLDRLLRIIVLRVYRLMRLEFIGIYLCEREDDFALLKYKWPKKQNPLPARIHLQSSLVKAIKEKRTPFGLDEAELDKETEGLPDYGAIIPSFMDHTLIGFLFLGPKKKGDFSPRDYEVFETLSVQAALAIENALYIEEYKKTQEALFQAEKLANIGVMASGMSHQMNNRLQVISLIAGDIKDEVNFLDEADPETLKTFIAHVKENMERLEEEIKHGREVIRGLLDYSKKKQIRFLLVDFKKDILQDALKLLYTKQKIEDAEIDLQIQEDLPLIWAEPTQMAEVVFNLLDNAYEAIIMKKNYLNDSDFKGKITLKAYSINEFFRIDVEDNGIGIREEDKKKIFIPFFTTKSSTKSGFGLGMYVVKRIIESRKGKIWFESKYLEGTKFHIELLLLQL